MTENALESIGGARGDLRLAVSRVEAARVLSIHPNSLDRLVKRGLLHPSRALRRPLFSLKELARFLTETT